MILCSESSNSQMKPLIILIRHFCSELSCPLGHRWSRHLPSWCAELRLRCCWSLGVRAEWFDAVLSGSIYLLYLSASHQV